MDPIYVFLLGGYIVPAIHTFLMTALANSYEHPDDGMDGILLNSIFSALLWPFLRFTGEDL